MEYDLLHPDPNEEKQKHKLKKLVQKPNSFFLDIKCKACGGLTHTFLVLKVSLNVNVEKF